MLQEQNLLRAEAEIFAPDGYIYAPTLKMEFASDKKNPGHASVKVMKPTWRMVFIMINLESDRINAKKW